MQTLLRPIRRTGWFCALLLALPVPSPAQEAAGGADHEAVARDAIGQVWSPYCPGQMLEICTSAPGAALRDSIRTYAQAGWTADELIEWVVGNHGEEYRAVPRASGRGLVVWLVPPLGILLGIGVVLIVIRRMRAREPSVLDEAPIALSPEEEERLRRALAEAEASEEPAF